MTNFEIGQLVRCTRDFDHADLPVRPQKGAFYRVTGICRDMNLYNAADRGGLVMALELEGVGEGQAWDKSSFQLAREGSIEAVYRIDHGNGASFESHPYAASFDNLHRQENRHV